MTPGGGGGGGAAGIGGVASSALGGYRFPSEASHHPGPWDESLMIAIVSRSPATVALAPNTSS